MVSWSLGVLWHGMVCSGIPECLLGFLVVFCLPICFIGVTHSSCPVILGSTL
jgi:hypothetical protein